MVESFWNKHTGTSIGNHRKVGGHAIEITSEEDEKGGPEASHVLGHRGTPVPVEWAMNLRSYAQEQKGPGFPHRRRSRKEWPPDDEKEDDEREGGGGAAGNKKIEEERRWDRSSGSSSERFVRNFGRERAARGIRIYARIDPQEG